MDALEEPVGRQALDVATDRHVRDAEALDEVRDLDGTRLLDELARAVKDIPQLTVVTNSVPVAQLLHESGAPGQTVVLTGGVRTPSDALVGPVAVSALRNLHVDLLFLGAHGVDGRTGLTTPNLVEAETNRALVASARHVCLLADSSKWGTIGLSTFADLADVDLFVTDNAFPERARDAARESVGSLEIVEA